MKNKIIISVAAIAAFLMVSSANAVPLLNKKADVTGEKYELNDSTIEEKLDKLLYKYKDNLKDINKNFDNYYEKIKNDGLLLRFSFLRSKFFNIKQILPDSLQVKYNKLKSEFIDIIDTGNIYILGGGKTDIEVELIKERIWIFGRKIEWITGYESEFWIAHSTMLLLEQECVIGLIILFTGLGAPLRIALEITGLLEDEGFEKLCELDQGKGIHGIVHNLYTDSNPEELKYLGPQ